MDSLTEKDLFLSSLTTQSENTKQMYTKKYVLIKNQLKTDLHLLSVQQVIDYFDTMTSNKNLPASNNTKACLLNIIIMVMKLYPEFKDEYDSLCSLREIFKTEIAKNLVEKNNNTEVHDVDTLISYTNGLYISGLYKEFIINFLLTNYFCRNEDLNLAITDDLSKIEEQTGNFLIYTPSQVLFIRNNYKTHRFYGRKENPITDTRFIIAVKNMLGKKLTTKQHSYEIKKSTLGNVGEANYLKSFIRKVQKTNDIELLFRIRDYRGTDLETLLTSYNIKVNLFRNDDETS